MKVCVIGSGAREHALAHVLSRTAEVVVTPGNPLIPGSTDQPPTEIDADLYVVGPEAPWSTAWPTASARAGGWCSDPAPTGRASRGRRPG